MFSPIGFTHNQLCLHCMIKISLQTEILTQCSSSVCCLDPTSCKVNCLPNETLLYLTSWSIKVKESKPNRQLECHVHELNQSMSKSQHPFTLTYFPTCTLVCFFMRHIVKKMANYIFICLTACGIYITASNN